MTGAAAITVDELADEIRHFADLLAILMGGPDAGEATDGARLVALEIGAKADRIKEAVQRE